MREPIPEEVRRFILTSVPSVPFVEALLLFRGNAPDPLSIEQVARRLYVGEREAADVVGQLRAAGMIESVADRGNRYQPASPELAAALDSFAAAYRSSLVEVTALIHSRTGRMAHQFADAFRLRKE